MNLIISGFARLLAPAGYVNDVPPPVPEDTTPPTVGLAASATTVTQKQEITLTATAIDNVAVTKVEFYRGDLLIDTKNAAPYTTKLMLTEEDNGTLQFKTKAYDAKDNVSTSAVVEVTVEIVVVPVAPVFQFTIEAQLQAAYNAAIAGAANGVKRAAGANAIVNAMKQDYRLYIYQGDNLVVPVEFSGDMKVVNDGVDVAITLGVPDSSDPVIAAQLSQGVWHFSLEGGAQYARFIKGSVGPAGSDKLLTLSSDPEPGVGTSFSFKLIVPRSLDNVSTEVPGTPVDTTAPTITLAASKTSITSEDTTTLTATVADNVAVTKVEFLRNGVVFETKLEAPWVATQSLGAADNGTIVYTARASDFAENATTSASVNVVVAVATYLRFEDLIITQGLADSMRGAALAANSGTTSDGKRMASAQAVINYMSPWQVLKIYCNDEVIYDIAFAGPMLVHNANGDVSIGLNNIVSGSATRDADLDSGVWTFKVLGGSAYTRPIAGSVGSPGSGAAMVLNSSPVQGQLFNTIPRFTLSPSIDGLT
jgi:hypothetical protein